MQCAIAISAFDDEELHDLGVSRGDVTFAPDMTIQEFYAAEHRFRRALPLRAISWWDSAESRSRASWVVRKRHSERSRDYCDALLEWLRLPTPSSPAHIIDLDWLFSTSQDTLDKWRQTRPLHDTLMRNLEQWLDNPRYELTESLIDENLLADAMQRSMSHLSQREQLILRMRYGLGDNPSLTLEEVGAEFRLTRERVRQLEATGLESLSHPAHRPTKDLAVSILRPTLRLPTPFAFAPLTSIVQLVKSRLPAFGRLLLDTYDIADRLSICTSLGTLCKGRFALGYGATADNARIAAAVDAYMRGDPIKLPTPLATIQRHCPALYSLEDRDCTAALELAVEAGHHSGYATPGSKQQAHIDAIHLHQRMMDAGSYVNHTFLGRRDPLLQHHYPDGDLARRDLDAALAHPHMFMRLGDREWIALHQKLRIEGFIQPTRGIGTHDYRSSRDSRVGQISAVLAQLGVARLSDIRAQLPDLPEGTIHGLVNSRGDFERIAPGTYTLTDTDIAPHEDKLLTSWHIQNYILSRQSGGNLRDYRSWTTSLEYKWCMWSRAHDPILYRFLLFYSQIDKWPISAAERVASHAEHAHLARDPGPPAFTPSGPAFILDPDEFVRILFMSVVHKGANPITVNRSLGRRPKITTTWPYLACMIAAGWIEDCTMFHQWHALTPRTSYREQLIQDLLCERLHSGTNSQDGDSLLAIRASAQEGLAHGKCYWLRPDQRSNLQRTLQDELPETPVTEPLTLEDFLTNMRTQRTIDNLFHPHIHITGPGDSD